MPLIADILDVAKGLKEAAHATRVRYLDPAAVSETARLAEPEFARMISGVAQRGDAMHVQSRPYKAMWEGVPEADRIAWINETERGTKLDGAAGELQVRHLDRMAQVYQTDKAHGFEYDPVENYVSHIYKNEADAQAVIGHLRQTLGPQWFRKARSIDYISTAMILGKELRTTNPEEIDTLREMATIVSSEKMAMLGRLQELGLALPVKASKKLIKQGELRTGFLVNAPNGKQWLIHGDLAPLWKNVMEQKSLWASKGLGGSAFRGWMAFKNLYVPLKLAASAFHMVHVAHIDMVERLSTALEHGLRSDDWGTAMTMAADFLPRGIRKEGMNIIQKWDMPASTWTRAEREAIDLIKEGGGSPKLPEDFRTKAADSFAAAMAKGSPLLLWHGTRRMLEKVSGVMFEKWIPSLKVSSYLREMRLAVERDPSLITDNIRRRRLAVDTWKSIDNRYGEMFYKTLFWDRYLRDMGVASFLSLGWNVGFVREFGQALAIDTPRLLAKMLRGEASRADITHKMIFSYLYLTFGAAWLGAMNFAMTGEAPKTIEDWFYPRTGELNPDGTPRRVTSPFYNRELMALAKHIGAEGWLSGPIHMVADKMVFSPVVELMKNRDYFGYDIYDPTAPLYKQGAQVAKFIAGESLPITITQAKRIADTEGKGLDIALSVSGFGPAPAYATQRPAEGKIAGLFQHRYGAITRTLAQKDKDAIKHDLKMAVLSGDQARIGDALNRAAVAGLTKKNFKALGFPPDLVQFRALSAEDQASLLSQMGPEDVARYAWFTHREVQAHMNDLGPTVAEFLDKARKGEVKPPAFGMRKQ